MRVPRLQRRGGALAVAVPEVRCLAVNATKRGCTLVGRAGGPTNAPIFQYYYSTVIIFMAPAVAVLLDSWSPR